MRRLLSLSLIALVLVAEATAVWPGLAAAQEAAAPVKAQEGATPVAAATPAAKEAVAPKEGGKPAAGDPAKMPGAATDAKDKKAAEPAKKHVMKHVTKPKKKAAPASAHAEGEAKGEAHHAGEEHAGEMHPEGTVWSYEGETGPEYWSSLDKANSACATGRMQSPIDLQDSIRVSQPELTFEYYPGEWQIVNNGHSVQVTVPAGSFLTVDGHQYVLAQFHFHHPERGGDHGQALRHGDPPWCIRIARASWRWWRCCCRMGRRMR